jgi:RHS repeat-associated protein
LRDYYGYDGHGNVRFLFGSGDEGSITVSDTYTYDAFGSLIEDWHYSVSATPNNYLYCGERWDSDLGMYFLRARYMNPNSGRFWTMDSFEGKQADPLSLHKYLYCNANPVNGIDPSGHTTLVEVMTSVTNTLMLAARVMSAISRGYALANGITTVVSTAQLFLDIGMGGAISQEIEKAITTYLGNLLTTPVREVRWLFERRFWETAGESLVQNTPRIVKTLLSRSQVMKEVLSTLASGVKDLGKSGGPRLVVYLPIPPNIPVPDMKPIDLPIPAVRLGPYKVGVALKIGGGSNIGGRVFGLGVSKGKGTQPVQFFRQDYGHWHGGVARGDYTWLDSSTGDYQIHYTIP